MSIHWLGSPMYSNASYLDGPSGTNWTRCCHGNGRRPKLRKPTTPHSACVRSFAKHSICRATGTEHAKVQVDPPFCILPPEDHTPPEPSNVEGVQRLRLVVRGTLCTAAPQTRTLLITRRSDALQNTRRWRSMNVAETRQRCVIASCMTFALSTPDRPIIGPTCRTIRYPCCPYAPSFQNRLHPRAPGARRFLGPSGIAPPLDPRKARRSGAAPGTPSMFHIKPGHSKHANHPRDYRDHVQGQGQAIEGQEGVERHECAI